MKIKYPQHYEGLKANDSSTSDYAYRIITAKGYPGYMLWLDGGATTLWETWQAEDSHNHHMYSDCMSWLMKSLIGIRPTFDAPSFIEAIIQPAIVGGLEWAKGALITCKGRIASEWRRHEAGVTLNVSIPEGVRAKVCLPDGRVAIIQGMRETSFEINQ